MRNEALEAYFQTQKELVQKDLEKQLVQKDLEFQKQLVQKDFDNMRKELLQAKGLLTARGVYECVAQQAWDEQKDAGNVKGGCNVANSPNILKPAVGPSCCMTLHGSVTPRRM